MRLHIIAVGTKMLSWIKEGFTEYHKRFTQDFPLSLTEIPLAKRPKNMKENEIKKIKQEEGQKIINIISPKSITIALDEHGKNWSTKELSDTLRVLQTKTAILNFLIGGPDGLSEECLSKASIRWSLSPLTLPHPLVRIILVEQLYRAVSILKNHPYHRD